MKNLGYKKPNPIIFGILKLGSWFMNTFFYNLKIERNDLKQAKRGKKVILCNHESKVDFFAMFQAVPGMPHAVISNSFLRSLKINPLMKEIGCIGKNQFQTSVADLRTMKSVLDNDKTLVFYPAGLMAEIGTPTPIPKATGKAVKWLDADVYIGKISGMYLTNPKWSKKLRKGKPTFSIYKLYDREELKTLSASEVHETVCQHLSFSAYEENLKRGVEYKNGDNVEGLENVLYKCPHCESEFTITASGNVLTCEKCGYSVVSNKLGILNKNCEKPIVYTLPNEWYSYIENSVMKEVEKDDFTLETEAEIYKINDKKHAFELAGNGTVSYDKTNFYINGTLFGEEFKQEVYAATFPILPFIPGKYFEIQNGNDIFRICPKNPETVMRWVLAIKCAYQILNKD